MTPLHRTATDPEWLLINIRGHEIGANQQIMYDQLCQAWKNLAGPCGTVAHVSPGWPIVCSLPWLKSTDTAKITEIWLLGHIPVLHLFLNCSSCFSVDLILQWTGLNNCLGPHKLPYLLHEHGEFYEWIFCIHCEWDQLISQLASDVFMKCVLIVYNVTQGCLMFML